MATYILIAFITIILGIEVYYWLWWLPRNWKDTREAGDIEAFKRLYGEDGDVWKLMKDGRL